MLDDETDNQGENDMNPLMNENNYFNDTGNSSKFDDSFDDSRLINNIPLAIKRSLV